MLFRVGLTALFFVTGISVACPQAEESQPTPATVAEAQRVFDLSTFPLVDPLGEPRQIRLASQSYDAKGGVEAVANKLRETLEERGFEAQESSVITPAYASLLLEKSRFKLAVTCTPGSQPEATSVMVINLGNVAIESLPLPKDWSVTYAGPANAIYSTAAPPEQAKAACRKLLEADGWRWFGDTSVSFFMRKNAIRLQVMISASPTQPGQSMIQLSTEQLSSEIPYPNQLFALQFSDSTGGMVMDSELSMEDFVTALRSAMEDGNWKATTETPIKIDFHDHLIFRSPAGEMADCELFEFENLRRCRLEYRTQTQLQELEAQAAEQKKELQMQRERDAQVTVIELPGIEGVKLTEQKPNRLEFATNSKKARQALLVWFKAMEAKGWKRTNTLDSANVGEYTLEREQAKLEVSFVDPGFLAGEITISANTKTELKLLK